MKKRYTALIPLVNPAENADDHDLLEIYSDPFQYSEDIDAFLKQELKSINKGWERISARLRTINLQASAHNAVEAVRKLNLPKPRWGLYQWFKPQAWLERQRLGTVNPLRVSEGDSAELGIALVLLTSASGNNETEIIATGKLRAQGPKSNDVEVLPVAGMAEKLRFLLQQRIKGYLPNKRLLCFTPLHYLQGNGEIGNVSDLPEFALLSSHDIEVVPIAWLSEAVKYLRIRTTRMMTGDRRILVALALTFATSLILAIYQYCLWREIPLEWVAPPFSMQSLPFQACPSKDVNSSYDALDIHAGPNGKLVIAQESMMGWFLNHKVDYYDILQPRLGYQVTNILLGEKSDIVIFQNSQNNPNITSKSPYYSLISLGSQEEDRILIVLVSRTRLDPDKLKDDFNSKFQRNPVTGNFELNGAANYLMKKAAGKIKFSFTQNDKISTKCQ